MVKQSLTELLIQTIAKTIVSTRGAYTLSRKWIYFVIALFLFVFLFIFLSKGIISYEAETMKCDDRVNAMLVANELILSENCFAYSGKMDANMGIGRGIIDYARLSLGITGQCLEDNRGEVGYEVKITSESQEFQEAILEIAKAPEIAGKYTELSRRVLLYIDGKIIPAIIKIKVGAKC